MDKWIYWFEELGKEFNGIVGKKCANLGELRKGGFPTSPGFALSINAYEMFLRESGAFEEISSFFASFKADPNDPNDLPKFEEASKKAREIVESKRMPENMEELISIYYEELCKKIGCPEVSVSTRSAGPISHPGQYETYLHVKGRENVLQNIKKVWSSTFNQRSLIARARKNLPLFFDPIGVGILKMVNARASGVMFTLNPVNGDISKIVIDGNWGLGESVVSGSTSIDEWIVDKVTFDIIKTDISSKLIQYELDPKTGKTEYIDVSPEKQNIPCLQREEVICLAKIGKEIEKYFGVPQDIEWAIDKDLPINQNIIILQTRPETTFSKRKAESITEGITSALDYVTKVVKTPVKI
jgi:pyruvate,water dikinase